jgi:hypothetical protein
VMEPLAGLPGKKPVGRESSSRRAEQKTNLGLVQVSGSERNKIGVTIWLEYGMKHRV